MSDYSKLKELAEAATKGVWRYGPGDGESESPIVFVDLPQASSVAISILFEGDWATDVDAKFVSEANPAVVLELIADNEALSQDALRYRRLRDGVCTVANSRRELIVLEDFDALDGEFASGGEMLDAALDAAMSKEASNG